MNAKQDLERQLMMAARDNGISSVLFRNAVGRKLGLSVTDSECLSFLTIKGGTATPTELGRYTGLTSGSTTAMLDRLEKAQLITRQPNPNDRRGSIIEISERYKAMAMPLVMGVQKANAKLFASYSQQELQTIVDFLNRFTQNTNDAAQAIEKTEK